MKPVASEDLIRDRAETWGAFTHGATVAAAAVTVLLVLMAIFLL